MSEIQMPDVRENIEQRILTLEGLLEHDNEQDRQIHHKALHQLRMALSEINKVKIVEEHFKNITVEQFEKDLKELGVENYISKMKEN